MPAYLLARVKINDPKAYTEYTKRSKLAVERFGGEFLVRGTEPTVLEGEADGLRTVIVRFPDVETARRFYESDDYTQARHFRAPPVAEASFLVFEGG